METGHYLKATVLKLLSEASKAEAGKPEAGDLEGKEMEGFSITRSAEAHQGINHTASRNMSQEPALVLVAEDDNVNRMMLRESLELAGFQVETVENGLQALSAFKRLQPDIVLMDVMMPKMDGISACSAIRDLPEGDHIPVLMITGLADKESIHNCYAAGATDFMTKPINLMILQQRMQYMLRASRAFNELSQSKARLAEAQRIARLGNWEWIVENNLLVWSDETYCIFGLQTHEFEGTYEALLKRIHPDDKDQFIRSIQATLHEGITLSVDHRILLADGSERVVHQQAEAICDEMGKTIRIAGTIQDISDRKRTEEKIIYLAYHDSLTGLPNRSFFKQSLTNELNHAERHGNMVGLLFLDLDHFKHINDSFGHGAGDQILCDVAKRITKCVRTSDNTSRIDGHLSSPKVTRFGGDEFAVLLTDISRIEDAARVAQRLIDLLSEPFIIEAQEVFIGASIGITVYPMGGSDADTLLKNADVAMYHAKESGRNNYQFFTKSMNRMAFERLTLETRLHKALENDEFRLYYQPQLDLKTGKIVGVEALIRWQQPEMGLVSPLEFIPLAEETGLIVPIGDWVIRTACAQNSAWQRANYPPVRMAVNVSGRQLKQKELIAVVYGALKDTGLDPGWFELELTENSIMQTLEASLAMLNRLKAIGIRLSIDDFGIGYSSFNHLKRFPVDTLKIDRSFVKDIPDNSDTKAIIKAMIAMAKGLNMRVIAEGVQAEGQLRFLREQGCDWMQGYLFSRPVPGDEITTFLAEGRNLYGQSGCSIDTERETDTVAA